MALKGDNPPPPDDEKGHGSDNPDEGGSTKKTGGRKPAKMTIAIVVAIALLLVASSLGYLLFIQNGPVNGPVKTVLSDRLRSPEQDNNVSQVIVGNDTITYNYTTVPGQLDYSVGDIISGTTGYGYLRKIVAINQVGSSVIIQTENASLCDVIQDGVLEVNETLSANYSSTTTIQGQISGQPAHIALGADTGWVGLEFDKNVDRTVHAGSVDVQVAGRIIGKVSINLYVRIGLFHVKELRFSASITGEVQLSVSAPCDVTVDAQEEVFAAFDLPPIVRTIKDLEKLTLLKAPITPKIQFLTGTSLRVSAAMSTNIDSKFSASFGLVKNDDGSYTKTQHFSNTTTCDGTQKDFSAEVTCFAITPRVKLLVFGTVGPYFDLQPYLKFQVTSGVNYASSWGVYLGIKGVLGLAIDIFGKELKPVSFQLFGFEIKLKNMSPLVGKWNVVSVFVDGETISQSITGSWTEIKSDGTYNSYWSQGGATEQGTWKDLGNGQLELHTDSSAFGGAAGTMTVQYTLSASSLTYSYSYTDAEGPHTSVTSFTKATT